jgi:hypothetical protein
MWLVILIFIGWLVLVVLKGRAFHRAFKSGQISFRMQWFCFYTYFLLPFWVLCIIAETHKIGKLYILPDAFIVIILGLIGLIIAVFIGLHMRWLWGYYLNWILLAAKTLNFAMGISIQEEDINNIAAFVVALVIFGLIYTLPNIIYFHKRKLLFTRMLIIKRS